MSGRRRRLVVGTLVLTVAFELVASLKPTGNEFEGDQSLRQWLKERNNCTWPHCLPKCEPCQHAGHRVDRCYTSYISSAFACSTKKPNSACFLGSCLCNPGYCATPMKETLKDGWEVHDMADDQKDFNHFECVKIKCVDEGTGPSPPSYEATWYDRLWLAFTPDSEDFPPPEYMKTHWHEYVGGIIVLPLILFIIGVAVAVTVAVVLCCGCTGHHFVHGRVDGHPALTGAKTKGSSSIPTKPTYTCLIILAVVVFVLVTFATVKRTLENKASTQLISDTLGLIHNDGQIVARQALRINTTVQNFFTHVSEFVHDCTHGKASLVKPVLQVVNMSKIIQDDLSQYKAMVNNYTNRVEPIPSKVHTAQEYLIANEDYLSFLPNVPLILLGLICLGILGEALITVRHGTSSFAKCVDKGLRMSVVIFVFIILAVATAIMVGSLFSITFAHFCLHPDRNTMAYSSLANSSIIANMTEYYVMGDKANPVFKMSQMARKYLVGLNGVYVNFQSGIDFVESLCTANSHINVTSLAVEAIDVLANADHILRANSIWPYYQLVVRRGICKDLTRSLTQMVFLQTIVGLIIFPVCAIATHTFLVKWSAWEKYVEKGGQASMLSRGDSEWEDEDAGEDEYEYESE